MRKAGWVTVARRAHKPLKVFPFGAADEAMVIGTVHS